MEKPNQPIQYVTYVSGGWEVQQGAAIIEKPVSLTVNGEIWLTMMCTPIDLEALAAGFLFNEGFIQTADEIAQVRLCANGENVDIWLNHPVQKPAQWRKTTGCTGGVTGQMDDPQATDEVNSVSYMPHLYEGIPLTSNQVSNLIRSLFESQDLYRQTGGIHSSALSDGEKLYVVTEDIGRHNTLDKIAGRCLLENIQLEQRVLLTTGRISSEMMQKAARIGAAIVISRTAPSALAIQLAKTWNITLVGYARRNQFNIYSHNQRISSAPEILDNR